jgi:membrane associated rhomboid family serine protease
MEALTDYFENHQEQAFIAKTLALVLLVILAREFLTGLLSLLFLFFPLMFLIYIRFQMATTRKSFFAIIKEHITFIPVMRTETERKTERVPWVTYALILVNVLIFYCIELNLDPKTVSDNLVFLPDRPDLWNLPLSALTSMFLHAGNGHLWGNMTFLWVVGSAVERRIDSGSFLFLYLFTGLMGGLLYVFVEYASQGAPGHVLGASGAIAGIMGIFAVRCYFKSMIFPLPILGIFSLLFPVSLKIRLNSLVIIGLFFYSDLAGGLAQLSGGYSRIGHWVHLGGMITGMIVAGLYLRLGEDAIEERHLEIGIKAAATSEGIGEGEKSLAIALEHNPESGEAVLALAQLKSKFRATEEGEELYLRAVRLLLKDDPARALEAFEEYSHRYLVRLEPCLLDSLGSFALRMKQTETALRCFSLLAESKDATPRDRERALFHCGRLLEELGDEEMARVRYTELVQAYPDAAVAPKLRLKLGIDGAGEGEARSPASAAEAAAQVQEPRGLVTEVLQAAPTCPVCAAEMSRRRATNGSHAGRLFWVCREYPACRQVLPIPEG